MDPYFQLEWHFVKRNISSHWINPPTVKAFKKSFSSQIEMKKNPHLWRLPFAKKNLSKLFISQERFFRCHLHCCICMNRLWFMWISISMFTSCLSRSNLNNLNIQKILNYVQSKRVSSFLGTPKFSNECVFLLKYHPEKS